jgi:hypothetical protein
LFTFAVHENNNIKSRASVDDCVVGSRLSIKGGLGRR